jgi:hypothetical protein
MTIATGNISERGRTNNLFHVTICRRKAGGWGGVEASSSCPSSGFRVFIIVLAVVLVLDCFSPPADPRTSPITSRKASIARRSENEIPHQY